MGREQPGKRQRRISKVGQQIERWRRTRTKRSPMPEPLWREAVELAREHGVYAAARGLRVSYESLRTRAEAAGVARRAVRKAAPPLATFVEVRPVPPAAVGHVVEVTGCRASFPVVIPRPDRAGVRPRWFA